MTDEPRAMTRRRVLGSLVTVGGASAAAGSGTMAYWFDEEGSSSNGIQNGTLELTFDSGSRTLGLAAELSSGERTSGSVTLVNDESVAGSLDVLIDYRENDDANDGKNRRTAEEVAEQLTVTNLEYGETDLLSDPDQDLPSEPTLHDLSTNDVDGSDDLSNLADPGAGTTFDIELELGTVNQSNGNFAGEGIDATVTFALNQIDEQ